MNQRKRKRKFKKVVYSGMTIPSLAGAGQVCFHFSGTPRGPWTMCLAQIPACGGVKVTVVAQHVPQLLDSAQTAGLVVMLWMVMRLLESLARVTGALAVEPTATLPKLTRIGSTTMEVIDP